MRPRRRLQGEALLGTRVGFEYMPGWNQGVSLAEALDAARDRDWQHGTTHAGPHRADIRLLYDERQARRLVSRGQQKLLSSAMILAAGETGGRRIAGAMVGVEQVMNRQVGNALAPGKRHAAHQAQRERILLGEMPGIAEPRRDRCLHGR